MKFIPNNVTATRQQAEDRLTSLGHVNFRFTALSFTNGASFYFESENGKVIRVSDHPLTGAKAFTTIQVSLFDAKPFTATKSTEITKFILTPQMIAAAAARKASN